MEQKINCSVCFSKPLTIILLLYVFLTFYFYLLIENSLQSDSQQLITFEEDGRFGNLLLETATLLLIGRKLNKQVNLLPQVAEKIDSFFSSLPAESINRTQVSFFITLNVILLFVFEVTEKWFVGKCIHF